MTSEKLAFALRPTVFTPKETLDAVTILDGDDRVSRIFVPEGRTSYESLEITSSILGRTKRISAGNGVIRLLEHDPALLSRRIQTIQAYSKNRFFLGVGTGSPGPQPGKTVQAMLERINKIKQGFESFPQGVEPPDIFVATLKRTIAARSAGKVDGLLLNFCSPQHAANLIESLDSSDKTDLELAIYLKIFYSSKDDGSAQRLMSKEFLNYDSIPQYHAMFAQDGTARAIRALREREDWKHGNMEVPRELLKVSLANPNPAELSAYIASFRKSGITLPVLYPYFPDEEKSEFKIETVKQILDSI
ncbi:MAG TPA: LLM class flavin-dependent oxidoreductase [Candidatus Bathyarchaeia archaeon]|nr:LLM class flavin-dependent oxidoreductase [Candidatus Bathyarchaeia archaeon]